jgi:nucleoside 2-deoxyribosyltransferase
MTHQIFGFEWEVTGAQNGEFGLIFFHENKSIGKFLMTHAATMVRVYDDSYKILSAIYEFSRSNHQILICLQEEKKPTTLPNILPMTVEEIYASYPQTISEKIGRILLLLYRFNPDIGADINAKFSSYMMYAKNEIEMRYILRLMKDKRLIDYNTIRQLPGGDVEYLSPRIEEQGWDLLEGQLLKREQSRKVFVAMWFDDSMDKAFQEIARSIQSHGFSAVRIDKKEHNNEISGEILYEIRQCKFMIADVTGQRHGVYFEAGYAIGMGIPVIWTCKADDFMNVHFDTRQYNHIVWKNESELFDKISSRIKGSVLE